MKMTPDAYASAVVHELQNGFSFGRSRAVDAVQTSEQYVRKGFASGVSPAFVAKRIAGKSSRSWGKSVAGLASGVREAPAPAGAPTPLARLAAGAPIVMVSMRGRSGLSTGSTACGLSSDWQPPLFGLDMSDAAFKALNDSELPATDALSEFKRASSSLPLIRQYWVNKKKGVGRMRMPGALYVEDSKNVKVIGTDEYRARREAAGAKKQRAAATYASISSSCPDECALRDNGCYAQQGKTAMSVRRLDAEARKFGLTSVQTAASEAYSIYSAHKGGAIPENTFFRFHVSGDSQTVEGTLLLADAYRDWHSRGGDKGWCYTHAWSKVPRRAWGKISTLASVDNPATDVVKAKSMGYAPAIVVESFGQITAMDHRTGNVTDYDKFEEQWDARRARRQFAEDPHGTVYIPCPAQVFELNLSRTEFKSGERNAHKGKNAGKGCLDCKLCFNDDFLRKNNLGIAFEAHGPGTKRALTVLGNKREPRAPRDTK